MASLVLLDVLGRRKLIGVSESCTNLLNKVVFPDSTIWGLKGEEQLEKLGIFNVRVGDRILLNFDI